ncbi:uncharacterized protein G2W53_029472 [Senna tora]|uniref:Uncharacterized protein n=1 Tax=Senna tora TaxID=362788 RepID=A0A834T5K9_9FABA|nr:uncharacterized protein G2W53_029472 [Senna tora]
MEKQKVEVQRIERRVEERKENGSIEREGIGTCFLIYR